MPKSQCETPGPSSPKQGLKRKITESSKEIKEKQQKTTMSEINIIEFWPCRDLTTCLKCVSDEKICPICKKHYLEYKKSTNFIPHSDVCDDRIKRPQYK